MSEEKLVEKAVEIRASDYEPLVGYLSPELILCTLPHSDPGNVPVWFRTNRNLTMSIRPYWDRETMLPMYPYGTIPRLVLIWIITQIVQKRTRHIVFDQSFNALLKAIGLDPATGGGKRSDRVRLLQQVERLSRAIIGYDIQEKGEEGKAWNDIQITRYGDTRTFWRRVEEGERAYLEIGETFSELVFARPVPLNLDVVLGLKRSPLSVDLYAWMSYTSHVYGRRCDMSISWEDLSKQLGGEYKLLRHFRAKVREALPDIQALYSNLKIDASDEKKFTVLAGSRPSVDFGRYRKRERANGVDGDRVVEIQKEIHKNPVEP